MNRRTALDQLPARAPRGRTNTRPTYVERQAARERRHELDRLRTRSYLAAAQRLAGIPRGQL